MADPGAMSVLDASSAMGAAPLAAASVAAASVTAASVTAVPVAAAFAVALATCVLLALVAPRLRWVDAPQAGGGEPGRKLQRAPVPPVAGAAILAGWLAAAALAGAPALLPGEHALLPMDAQRELVRLAAALALCAAFLVGTLDDVRRGGLSPAAKLAGQLLAGSLLALPAWFSGAELAPSAQALGTTLACAFAAAVFLNALNTFDNADGAASGVAAIGLGAGGAPILCAAVAGVLPPGLFLRRRAPGTPLAYLGDGGSHLLGMALLLVPAAWPALALPLLDLARVALERLRAGEPPWRGDRRHLAHRLERRGLGPLAVAALLWASAALPLLVPGPAGWLALALAFAALVAVGKPPGRGACERRGLPR